MRSALSIVIFAALFSTTAYSHASWPRHVRKSIETIESKGVGEMGVYLKELPEGPELRVDADRPWYLASTIKVPVAIILLQAVEKGELSLDQSLAIGKSDFIDGTGDLRFARPGTKYSLETLIEKMIVHSDSTAADALIRLLGPEKLNERLGAVVDGFGPITDLLSVRRNAYGEIHPRAKGLTNLDFIQLKEFKSHETRLNALRARLSLTREELRVNSITEAFERYYSKGLNSAALSKFGELLEKLSRGILLSPDHTELLLGYMSRMTTGEKRIKAGLPKGLKFAQKTGTQVRRICNIGIITAENPEKKLVVSACVEKFDDQPAAEWMLRDLGRAIADSGVFGPVK